MKARAHRGPDWDAVPEDTDSDHDTRRLRLSTLQRWVLGNCI